MQQGLGYAEILDIPSVYSSNGNAFYEHGRTCADGKTEQELDYLETLIPELAENATKKKPI